MVQSYVPGTPLSAAMICCVERVSLRLLQHGLYGWLLWMKVDAVDM
jgi:hypothetical protein